MTLVETLVKDIRQKRPMTERQEINSDTTEQQCRKFKKSLVFLVWDYPQQPRPTAT